MKRLIISISSIFVLGGLLVPGLVSAQAAPGTISQEDFDSLLEIYNEDFLDDDTGLPAGINEQLSVRLRPNYPKPNQVVSFSIASYSTNLDKALISWSVNGVLQKREIGLKTFDFQLGDLTENSRVDLIIEKSGGGNIRKTYNIKPSELDLIYEAETYTPPFYSGKALFTFQSKVKVLALPRMTDDSGKFISKEDFVYRWKLNGEFVQASSGYGKYVFTHTGSIIDSDLQISVEASPRSSNTTSRNSVTIAAITPRLLIYENNPIYGTIFERAIRGLHFLNREEIEFEAIPFFFSKDDVSSGLQFDWAMNGNRVTNPSNPKKVVFRLEEKQEGVADIFLRAKTSNKILQSSTSGFELQFDSEQLTNFSF